MNALRMRSREKSKFLETNENELTTTQNMGQSDGSPHREVNSDMGLPKKDRKMSNKQCFSISTRTTGTTTNKAQNK